MSDHITALAKEMQLALDDMQSLPPDSCPPIDFVTLTVRNAFNAGLMYERKRCVAVLKKRYGRDSSFMTAEIEKGEAV